MTLPDDRPRPSVGNLVARFEKKVTPTASAAGPAPVPRPLGTSGSFSSYNGTPPSWIKKKDAVSPPSTSDTATASPTAAPVPTTAAPALPTTDPIPDDPFVVQAEKFTPAPEPTYEPTPAPEPVAGPSSEPAVPSPVTPEPSVVSPAKPTPKTSAPKPTPGDSPKRSTNIQSTRSTKMPPAPRTSYFNKSTNVGPSSSTSTLNKAKSTSSLKPTTPSTTTPRFMTPTTASKTRSTAESYPVPTPLKPQHTGTSTTSRRAATPSSSKPVAFPGSSPSTTTPKVRAALFAPTASSLAKARNVEDPMVRKPAPPSSYSPRTTGRPRSGSTGSGSATALKPLHLPTKSSVSASGSTRRMVAVPRQGKVEPANERSQEVEQPMQNTAEDQALQESALQYNEAVDLSEPAPTAEYGSTENVSHDAEEHPGSTSDSASTYLNGHSKQESEPSEPVVVEPETTYEEPAQGTLEPEADVPEIPSDS